MKTLLTRKMYPRKAYSIEGGPWNGKRLCLAGRDTYVFRIGSFFGRYVLRGNSGRLIWENHK